jgi:hypothetical protein
MREEYGQGVWYDPQGEVAHKVFEYRTEFWWLVDRAFWQGYSKRAMESFVEDEGGEESEFLQYLFINIVPQRLRHLIRRPSTERAVKLVAVYLFTLLVGFGYLYRALDYSA